ncbi:MAG: gamma-glutamylcyclotransferase [Lachnospiraceae bacterium]|nr:gamma-glutamylcyclotransferase [Lachnospiraceae bacterium]
MENRSDKTNSPKAPKERLYIAYGSNLNLEQMRHRCPTAEVVGRSLLKNWRLMFRGNNGAAVATIERSTGDNVPILVWRLRPQDEQALDRYEGWPYLYRKETIRLTLENRRVSAMVYIMNEKDHHYGLPSSAYFETIVTGYRSAGFDENILHRAVCDSLGEV